MYSYVLYYYIEKSGFNAVSASLVIVSITIGIRHKFTNLNLSLIKSCILV